MLCMVFLLFLVLGATLPFIRAKQVSEHIRESFDCAVFYGIEGQYGQDWAAIVEDSGEALLTRFNIIEQAKERISSGEDFESVAKEVSRFSQIEYQVSRGTLNPILEETAIYMSDGEVSDIIQTEQNYYLIRCVDDFDEVLSSENESQVFGKLRYATWSQSFTSYAKEHTVGISEEIWENLHFYQTTAFTSDDLYETYDRYLASVTN